MKKIKPILAFGVCCGFVLSANADGYQFPGGAGTASDPYQIVTAEDLDHVRDYLENSEVNFKLMNDIDLSEYLNGGSWQPIGNTTNNSFTGVFDGGNHTISNLVMLGGSDGLGFFGRISSPGTVKNLIIDNAEVSGNSWCGILVSTNGNWERDGGTISNCRVSNSFLEGAGSLGAIAGVNEGTVLDCSGINNIIEGMGSSIGGILGESSSRSSNPRIANNFSLASVTGDGNNVSGLIGLLNLEQNPNYEAALQNCAAYGTVAGTGVIGGIVGYQLTSSTIIDNCYSAANVSGYQVGGIGGAPVGGKIQNCYVSGNVNSITGDEPWAGGIASTAYREISNCYFSGTISGEGKMGAIAGRNWGDLIVENCYYNSEGATMNMGEGNDEEKFDAHGLLPEEMKSLKNFSFSQPDKWQIYGAQNEAYRVG